MAVRDTLDLSEGSPSLPRGRHRMTADEVAASQRGRILQAMTHVVARKGYAATTVGDVIGRAKVSRNPFYRMFADKEDCYLAAYVRVAGQLHDMVVEAGRPEPHWLERLRASLRVYLGAYAAAPAYARAYSVEIGAAGPRVADHRRVVLSRYADLIGGIGAELRAERPELPAPSDAVIYAAVGGGDELVVDAIRRGEVSRLTQLEPTLSRLYVSVLAGPAIAAELVR